MIDPECNKIIVRVGIGNAFKSVKRDIVSGQVLSEFLEMFPMLRQTYSTQSLLFTETELVKSSAALQQDDTLAPLCFNLTIDECISPISSEINICYLLNGLPGMALGTIATELDTLRRNLLETGLQMSTANCDVTFLRECGSQ